MDAKLEKRLAQLEQRIAQMEKHVQGSATHDWRSTIGMFAGDEVMERICQAALEFREADRRRARRRAVSPRRRKP